jgi:hypothetical protein
MTLGQVSAKVFPTSTGKKIGKPIMALKGFNCGNSSINRWLVG